MSWKFCYADLEAEHEADEVSLRRNSCRHEAMIDCDAEGSRLGDIWGKYADGSWTMHDEGVMRLTGRGGDWEQDGTVWLGRKRSRRVS